MDSIKNNDLINRCRESADNKRFGTAKSAGEAEGAKGGGDREHFDRVFGLTCSNCLSKRKWKNSHKSNKSNTFENSMKIFIETKMRRFHSPFHLCATSSNSYYRLSRSHLVPSPILLSLDTQKHP